MRVRVVGEPPDRARELLARVEQQGEVVEAGVAAAEPGAGLLDEHEQVLAAGAHRRAVAVAVVQLQAERALVEGDRAVEVRDREVRRCRAAAWRAASAPWASRSWTCRQSRACAAARSMAEDRGCMDIRARPRRGPRAVAVDRRRLAGVALERAREVQRVGEAGLPGDLADRAIGEAQQARRLDHDAVGDELLRRLPGDLRERVRQRRRRHRERVGVVRGVVVGGEVAFEHAARSGGRARGRRRRRRGARCARRHTSARSTAAGPRAGGAAGRRCAGRAGRRSRP